MTVVKALGRVWIPLVILLVIICGGFTVSRVRGIFGSDNSPSYAQGRSSDTEPFAAKHVMYTVFGPAGTVADISYFDTDSRPQPVDDARLPWSVTLTVRSATVVADVVAQGDSDTIGCRIVVDGEVKAEKVVTEPNAFTHCLVNAA